MTDRRTGGVDGTAPWRIAPELEYLSSDTIAGQPSAWWHDVLGVVGFDAPPLGADPAVPAAVSMTPALGPSSGLREVWRVPGHSDGAVAGRLGEVSYRALGDFLFGSIAIGEQSLAAEAGGEARRLECATAIAYRDLFALVAASGHPHLVRIWNYVPEINGQADGDERYRCFNSARQRAFRDSGREVMGTVPAASALGSPAGSPLSVYFLAARQPPRMIENPRQVSAYHYPPRYGKHSPVFSRACLLEDSVGTSLFISGTASIVGHESIHPGDVSAQTRETLTNILTLVGEANHDAGALRYDPAGLKLKVYVRCPADLPTIAAVIEDVLGPGVPAVFLRADICRSDLLVEIEAAGAAQRVAFSGETASYRRRPTERGAKMLT